MKLAITLVAAALLVGTGVFAIGTLPFWTETPWDGRITMRDDEIQKDVQYTVEIDACPDPACADPEPVHAGTLPASSDGAVSISNVPRSQIEGAGYRARIFEQASGALLGQSGVEAVAAPTPVAWGRTVVLAITPLIVVAAFLALSRFAGPTSSTVQEPPATTTARRTAAQPSPTTVAAPKTLTATMVRITVFNAANRLPLSDVRFWSPTKNGFLQADKAGQAGDFIVTGYAGDTIEVRAPGHSSQRVRLDTEQAAVGLAPQAIDVRIRVLGGRSGSALSRVPVRVTRASQELFAGTSDAHGELVVPMRLEPEDLIETVLETPGFVEGKTRFSQSVDGRQVDLRVYYLYEPEETTRARQLEVERRANVLLEACQLRHPTLAAWARTVDDVFAELLEDHAGWGPLLLPGPISPFRFHEALLSERAELIAEFEALMRDKNVVTALANIFSNAAMAVETPEAPLDEWTSGPPSALDPVARSTLQALRDALTRARSLLPPKRIPVFQEWGRIAAKGLDKPAKDRVARIAQLLRASTMLEVLRAVLRDPGWLNKLRA